MKTLQILTSDLDIAVFFFSQSGVCTFFCIDLPLHGASSSDKTSWSLHMILPPFERSTQAPCEIQSKFLLLYHSPLVVLRTMSENVRKNRCTGPSLARRQVRICT